MVLQHAELEQRELSSSVYQVEFTRAATEPEYPWTQQAVDMCAQTLYGECRGCSKAEQRLVVWCILNRVDSSEWPDTIEEVISQRDQFYGYSSSHPIEQELVDITLEVFQDWYEGKEADILVPYAKTSGYLYFSGDSSHQHNWFREEW